MYAIKHIANRYLLIKEDNYLWVNNYPAATKFDSQQKANQIILIIKDKYSVYTFAHRLCFHISTI